MQARARVGLFWVLLPCVMGCDDAGGSGTQQDPQLAGRWHRTADASSGNTKTDVSYTLNPDGTFEYAGVVSSAAGGAVVPQFSQFAGPDNTVRGLWKTAGQFLYAKPGGSQQWIVLGRYSITESRMVLHGGGKPQFWER